MIQLLSKVNIIDNSGGAVGRCIKILKPHGRLYARVGDIILVSIIETLMPKGSASGPSSGQGRDKKSKRLTRNNAAPRRGSLFKALIVRTKVLSHGRVPRGGSQGLGSNKNLAVFDDNAVILLRSNTGPGNSFVDISPIGTRIKGPISIELANDGLPGGQNRFKKVLSLTKQHY